MFLPSDSFPLLCPRFSEHLREGIRRGILSGFGRGRMRKSTKHQARTIGYPTAGIGLLLAIVLSARATPGGPGDSASPQSQQSGASFEQKLFGEMRWRCIGPFRGGRTVAISGVPHQPNVFYMAAVNGGVWKTTDFGNTWNPIFDDQPTGSVGALAVAPSDPNVIYVGSGEGLQRPD